MGARSQTRDHPRDKVVRREKIKATTKDITGMVITKAVEAVTQTMGTTDMTTDIGAAREAGNVATATTDRTGGQTPGRGQMEIGDPHTAITTPTIMETGLTLTMAEIILKIIGVDRIRDQGAKNTDLTTVTTTRATTGKTVGKITGKEEIVATDRMVIQVTAKVKDTMTMTDLGQERGMDMRIGKVEVGTDLRKGRNPQEVRNLW